MLLHIASAAGRIEWNICVSRLIRLALGALRGGAGTSIIPFDLRDRHAQPGATNESFPFDGNDDRGLGDDAPAVRRMGERQRLAAVARAWAGWDLAGDRAAQGVAARRPQVALAGQGPRSGLLHACGCRRARL